MRQPKQGRQVNQLVSMTIDELLEEFDFLGDWEDRCEYLIDLGMELPRLSESEKSEENRVHGCQSMVWMIVDVAKNDQTRLEIRADSDALIVRGLIAVLLTIYSGRTPKEILGTDVGELFTRLGLERHLSTTRRNGLYSMVKRVRGIAVRESESN
jgi:cysteine desulfuration protein SufE